ncbi:Reverse transcriptase zinc-binding domain [Arabidopsis thaliana x Arabidopsis arenosa]|uniref:Reverse transcriptase zinc-binding domain n=1 Tax=Arabidopsis thaliana x Arabidopsis arenosa TaxID=1240361 RepID=A0A8T2BIP3_9BRAS|nr:Reverse transcriptase zinc-binding domain [Arabidopsis thaliana x Arabidopsis arenosa]
MEKELNRTNICLIPKKMAAERLTDFRPISLCNVGYKIIGKVLANRLKKFLPKIISETQAAFVEGRLITDNILVAHELVHALNSGKKCSEEFMAIKTDISKAYDRVEWSFLKKAMKVLGFAEDWISLIMECVSSVRYQVLIDGTPYGDVKPSRGLRQGDPLSPYLFVLCTEMLVKMLQIAERKEQITGLKVARGAPAISHLLFADDSMLYCKQKNEELSQMVRIIEEYSLASGQRVNYQKSSIHFGKLIPEERRQEIKQQLRIENEGGEGVYLGLPESFNGSKVAILSYLKERLSQKVSGWQSNFLSPGGKEVMLKAVAMALPTYTMACFKLPKTVCQQLVSVMSDFWWKNKQEGRGMHWKAWDQLCKPKAVGGLGFKDIEAFNIALLGKQLWRMMERKESLMAKVYKSRYFRKSDPINAPLGSRPSFAWKSIHESQELIKQGARAVIGNGATVNIWKDQWLGSKPARPLRSAEMTDPHWYQQVSHSILGKDILLEDGREWNKELLRAMLSEEDRRMVEELRPGGNATGDCFTWDYSKSGHYTVKSGYWTLTQEIMKKKCTQEVTQPSLEPIYQLIWKQDSPPKIHHFLWKCLSNSISVAANMAYRHLARDNSCPRCPYKAETVNHLLFQCPFARLVWAISPIPAPSEGEWSRSLYGNLYTVLNINQNDPHWAGKEKLIPWILWRLWKNRNEIIFKGREYEANEVLRRAIEDSEDWARRKEASTQTVPLTTNGQKRTNWKKPPHTWVKCNTDGAWSRDSMISGIGWVLRDYRGRVKWLGARALPRVQSVVATELEALRWAMLMVARFNYNKVIFESDSQQVISLVKEQGSMPNLNPILQDIRHLCQQFEEVKFEFSFREANGVADRIAKESLSLRNYDPKLYSIVPSWVKNLVDKDAVLVTDSVLPEDRGQLTQIYLPIELTPDTLVWNYQKSGEYTVKSGYWFARTHQTNDQVVPTPHGSIELKTRMWKLPLLPKIKHFLWRTLSRALGTTTRLISRGMTIDPICSRCGLSDETINHVFFECPHSLLVWRKANIPLRQMHNLSDDIDELIKTFVDLQNNHVLTKEDQLLPFWILWRIWKARNNFVFNKFREDPVKVVSQSKAEVKEWLDSVQKQDHTTGRSETTGSTTGIWMPPPHSHVKCNVDAGFDKNTSIATGGWIVHNSLGHSTMWGSGRLCQTQSALEAEARALLAAIQQVWTASFKAVIFESDCEVLVKILNDDDHDISIQSICQDIKHWSKKFDNVSFQFTPRCNNRIAHLLAKSTSINRVYFSNISHVPPWLHHQLYSFHID